MWFNKFDKPYAQRIKRNYDFYWTYIERPLRIISDWFSWTRGSVEQQIMNEFKKHKYEIIISSSDYGVYRFMGIGDDEMDMYYILEGKDRKISWHTCVGGLIYLKGKINHMDYLSMEFLWEANSDISLEDRLEEFTKQTPIREKWKT